MKLHLTSSDATLFAGVSYASRDTSYDEVLTFPSGVTASGLTDVAFEYRTGATTNTGSITLAHVATGTTKTLTVGSTGSVDQ